MFDIIPLYCRNSYNDLCSGLVNDRGVGLSAVTAATTASSRSTSISSPRSASIPRSASTPRSASQGRGGSRKKARLGGRQGQSKVGLRVGVEQRNLLLVEAIKSLGDKLGGGLEETGAEDRFARLEARLKAEKQETERKDDLRKAEEDARWEKLNEMLAKIAEKR